MLTTFDLDQYVYAALTAGASGFLLKDVSPEQLVAAVRMVRSGMPCWRRPSPAGSWSGSRHARPAARPCTVTCPS